MARFGFLLVRGLMEERIEMCKIQEQEDIEMFIQVEEFVISFDMEEIKLVCKKVGFCSDFDEDAFFEWLKKISCISRIEGFGEELYINVDRSKFTEMDLREMLALFYRYDVDMKQLEIFLSDENKS